MRPKTELDSTKTELINKGLKFNADNNDVKTNKLGSTVTVSGDANITTKITQAGDDSTIAVALNKDLNVKTVTATDTVKAGTTTAGSQTATDNKGGTQTGNFVTGFRQHGMEYGRSCIRIWPCCYRRST